VVYLAAAGAEGLLYRMQAVKNVHRDSLLWRRSPGPKPSRWVEDSAA
jgi:hypothetical protein